MNIQFWSVYLNDHMAMLFKMFFLIIVLGVWGITFNKKEKDTPWLFILIYFISDPFTYYLINYHPK